MALREVIEDLSALIVDLQGYGRLTAGAVLALFGGNEIASVQSGLPVDDHESRKLLQPVFIVCENTGNHPVVGNNRRLVERKVVPDCVEDFLQLGGILLVVGICPLRVQRIGQMEGKRTLALEECIHSLGIRGSGKLYEDLPLSLASDFRLRHAELVDSVLENLYVLVYGIGNLALGRCMSEPLLKRRRFDLEKNAHSSLEVQSQLQGFCGKVLQALDVLSAVLLHCRHQGLPVICGC